MPDFAHPEWLWLLILTPLPAAWAWWKSRRRTGMRFSSVSAAKGTGSSLWTQFRGIPVAFRTLALILGVLALARPQERNVVHERNVEGIDVMLVLDMSTSMLAQDFEPNRFQAAREVANDFIENRSTDRVGLIVFAAEAYTQAPLTIDYLFLQEMLAEVEIGMIEDGTAVGTAIGMAVNRLRTSEAESKAVILLTDGQNNAGEIDPRTAAEIAEVLGIRIYSIGVGTRGEAPYVFKGPFGQSYRQLVPVQIDEEMLSAIAEQTGGRYFRATNREGLQNIYREISELETSEIESRTYTSFDEQYPFFLWPALGFLLMEVLLSTTRLRRLP